MKRGLVCAAAVACLLGAAPSAFAGPPDAAKVKRAAEEFDAGAAAFKAKDWELAASHFELADATLGSPKALRMAIRARLEAGQGARAATLAALALERYPNDADTKKLASDAIAKAEPNTHKLKVSCAPPCAVTIGARTMAGEPTTRWTIFLDPGKTSVGVSFIGGGDGAPQSVDAKAGGSSELRFEPTSSGQGAVAGAAAPAPPPADKPSSAELPPKDEPIGASGDPDAPPEGADAASGGSGLSPIFFVGGVVATLALGGVTIWSGIDTKNNPGPDKVREACAGQDTTCPEYQDGLAHEMRTNVLIGATIGAGVLTGVVGLFFTNWGGKHEPPAGTSAGAVPRAFVSQREAGLAVAGKF